jgi:hypothetical protein
MKFFISNSVDSFAFLGSLRSTSVNEPLTKPVVFEEKIGGNNVGSFSHCWCAK